MNTDDDDAEDAADLDADAVCFDIFTHIFHKKVLCTICDNTQ